MAEKIYLNIIWHMHQPYYYDSCQDIFTLPWVRTHATKDYLFMAKLADRFPQVRMTFNFTPSLIKQINLYLQGKTDLVWNHFEKEAKTQQKRKRLHFREFLLSPFTNPNQPFPFL